MRILFAVHSYYPEKDGVSIVTKYIAQGLAEKGNIIKVITERKLGLNEFDKYENVEIQRIVVKKVSNIFKGEKQKYIKVLTDFHPDILIIVCTQTWAFDWIKRNLKKYNFKKVLYTHGYSGLDQSGLIKKYFLWNDVKERNLFNIRNHFYWKNYYKKAVDYFKNLDLIVYICESGSDYLYAQKIGLTNGIVIRNAIEDRFFENKKEIQKSVDIITLLNVASYNENKNQESIIRAFYVADISNARLVFSGGRKTEYSEKLENMKRKYDEDLGYKDVVFYYGLSREQIYQLYNSSHIFVLSSKHESFSLVICEAGARGMAVISTDVGIACELEGCIIVQNEEQMAKKMKQLCENEELRYQNAIRLQDYCFKNFNIDDKIDLFEEKLLSILNKDKM